MNNFKTKIIVLGALLLIAVASSAGAGAAFPEGLALDGGIRDVLLNKTLKELRQAYPDRIISVKRSPQEVGTLTTIKFSLYGAVLILNSWGEGIVRIESTDNRYKTRNGGRTRQTLRKILALHPKGKFYFGAPFPPHFPDKSMNYQIDKGRVAFVLSTKNIPAVRFQSKNVTMDQKDVLDCKVEMIVIEAK